MVLFTVDRNKCKRDAACILECPLGIIRMDESQGVPVPAENAEDACINCGHCMAVCPGGALALSAMPLEESRQLQPDWRISPGRIEQFLKGRRSIRAYNKEPVGRDILEQLIDIARFAPSGINLQPVEWIIIHDPDTVRNIAREVTNWMKSLIQVRSPIAESLHMQNRVAAWEDGKDFICRGAPHLILSCALKDNVTAPVACTIAVTYLELAAASFGLGACWAGYVTMALSQWEPAQRMLGISKRRGCFGALLVGYPKFSYYRIPLRDKPRVTWK